jgi:predicted CXXCH cytochrome family protein
MSRVRSLVVGLVLFAPLAAAASDAPHNNYDPVVLANCDNCHLLHAAQGSYLSAKPGGNFALCDSCHGGLPATNSHGFGGTGWNPAAPGSSGTSHVWDQPVTNLGCTNPGGEMGQRLESGKLACSVCHDQHNNANGRQAGTWQHVSYALNVAQAPSTGTGGTLTVTSVAPGATAKGYLIDIVATSPVTFRLSNTGGVTASDWLGCSGAPTSPNVYVPYTTSPSNACAAAGSNLYLNDGTNVRVTFAGTPGAVGTQWKFYVSYPFYRIAGAEGEMCVACHQNRNMPDTTGADGTKVMSHPVGAAFGADERAVNLILDANGASTQTGSASDNIATNNLRLSPTNKVTCLSCHSMHNVDSNSTSSDLR